VESFSGALRGRPKLTEQKTGEKNVDSGLQVQLEKDGDGSTKTETWSVAYTLRVTMASVYAEVSKRR